METKLAGISQLSRENPDMVFTYIGHLTNKEMPETAQTYAPTTRDKTNIWFPVFLLILSLGGIAAVVWYLKKRE